jgi:hypothetical protein
LATISHQWYIKALRTLWLFGASLMTNRVHAVMAIWKANRAGLYMNLCGCCAVFFSNLNPP